MPTLSILPDKGIAHVAGSSMMTLAPPDEDEGWRFREMQMMPALYYEGAYIAYTGGTYCVPGGSSNPPTEILVIWEKYKG